MSTSFNQALNSLLSSFPDSQSHPPHDLNPDKLREDHGPNFGVIIQDWHRSNTLTTALNALLPDSNNNSLILRGETLANHRWVFPPKTTHCEKFWIAEPSLAKEETKHNGRNTGFNW